MRAFGLGAPSARGFPTEEPIELQKLDLAVTDSEIDELIGFLREVQSEIKIGNEPNWTASTRLSGWERMRKGIDLTIEVHGSDGRVKRPLAI